MIRQAIAKEQLEAAREELHKQQENIERGGLRDVAALWLAEDRVWHWSLQVEAGQGSQRLKMVRPITEALRWPLLATCGVCGGSLEIYPYPAPEGSGYCQKCSPAWLRSFLEFATKDTAPRGWKPRTERDQ